MSLKKQFSVSTLILALAFVAAGSAHADSSKELWDQDISIDLLEADLAETLTSMGKVLNASLSLHPKVIGKVTFTAKAEPAKSVLDAICRHHNLECYLLSGSPGLLRVEPAMSFSGFAENIDISLSGAPLEAVIESFTSISDGSLVTSGDFEGTVTVEVSDRPWPVVLQHLCSVHDCTIDWSADPALVTPGE